MIRSEKDIFRSVAILMKGRKEKQIFEKQRHVVSRKTFFHLKRTNMDI